MTEHQEAISRKQCNDVSEWWRLAVDMSILFYVFSKWPADCTIRVRVGVTSKPSMLEYRVDANPSPLKSNRMTMRKYRRYHGYTRQSSSRNEMALLDGLVIERSPPQTLACNPSNCSTITSTTTLCLWQNTDKNRLMSL
jgi:hypothetical protein